MSGPVVVVGAGRGLGRGMAEAVAGAGRPVIALARTAADVTDLATADPRITALPADAADPDVAARVIREHEPSALVLVAGAVPVMGPLTEQTWAGFSVNWEADVRITFEWLRAALRVPLASGGRIVVVSSGAAVKGSPASGGYAGAKATQRFLAAYTRALADQAGRGFQVTTLLPGMTPHGAVGRAGIGTYAQLSGRSEEDFVRGLGAVTTPEQAGAVVVDLLTTAREDLAEEYLLAGDRAQPLG